MLVSAALWLAAPPAPGLAGPEDAGSIGIGLVEDAESSQDERLRNYIVDHAAPGEVVRREIEVENASPKPQHIELYSAAASVQDGAFKAAEGRGGNDLSEWTTLEEPSVELGPGQHARVGVTIEVPKSATRGERYAAVLAEVTSEDGTVRQVNRVGVRIYLGVGPGGELPADFQIEGMDVTAPPEIEWPVLGAQVRNTGERAIDMSGSVTLRRSGGTMSAGPFEVTTGVTILPGRSGEVQAVLDERLPAGEWDAELVLASGDLEKSKVATVVIPVTPASEEPIDLGSIGLGAAILLTAIAVGLLLWRRFRSRPS